MWHEQAEIDCNDSQQCIWLQVKLSYPLVKRLDLAGNSNEGRADYHVLGKLCFVKIALLETNSGMATRQCPCFVK